MRQLLSMVSGVSQCERRESKCLCMGLVTKKVSDRVAKEYDCASVTE